MHVIEPKRPKISEAERKKRQAAVNYARASVRLEGFIVSPLSEELYRQYIDGRISLNELGARIDAHYKL